MQTLQIAAVTVDSKPDISSCPFPESVDVKDRGCCDHTAEAGLSAATSQELLTVAGVLTDMSH